MQTEATGRVRRAAGTRAHPQDVRRRSTEPATAAGSPAGRTRRPVCADRTATCSPGTVIRTSRRHTAMSRKQCDQGLAALITDLKQRGLLDETLILCTGEFGRTPAVEMSQNGGGAVAGRDHNHWGFSLWLAGGGIKGGTIHGATDEFGFKAVENRVSIHDLHATMLHLLGFGPRTPDVPFRRSRLPPDRPRRRSRQRGDCLKACPCLVRTVTPQRPVLRPGDGRRRHLRCLRTRRRRSSALGGSAPGRQLPARLPDAPQLPVRLLGLHRGTRY